MTVMEHLVDYVQSLTDKTVPGQVQTIAKKFFVDALSCLFLGTECTAIDLLLPYVRERRGQEACIFPGKRPVSTDAANCAMLCAMAAHSSDFDDMSIRFNGHPSALLVPVVLSVGQACNSSGKDLLMAYIAGVETDAILGGALQAHDCQKGINPTTLIGCFGAVVAAGRLFGLDRQQLIHALNIAANDTGGLKANFGTAAKDFSIGMAAWRSVFSVEAARRGIDASPDALDGPFGLIKSVCNRDADVDLLHRMIDIHRSDFIEPGLVMKPYPTCRGNHGGIDCITKIVVAHAVTPQQVEKIICRVDQATYDTDRYLCPKTPNEAKFSLPYCIAKILYRGRVEIEDFCGEVLRDMAPLKLLDRIEVLCVPELFPNSRFGAEVEVRLRNGEVYVEKELYAKGDPILPMTAQEVQEKLRACLIRAFGEERAAASAEFLCEFDSVGSAREILKYLYPKERF